MSAGNIGEAVAGQAPSGGGVEWRLLAARRGREHEQREAEDRSYLISTPKE